MRLSRSRPNRYRSDTAPSVRPGGLFKLAVLAAPAVESERRRTAIPRRLALDAGANAGQNTAPSLWDFVAASLAMGFAFARWHAGTRSEDPVDDGVVDLILYCPVRGPSAGHCRFPVAMAYRGNHMGIGAARSKDGGTGAGGRDSSRRSTINGRRLTSAPGNHLQELAWATWLEGQLVISCCAGGRCRPSAQR